MEKIIAYMLWPLTGLSILSLTMLVLWLYQLRTKNAGVVDMGWALGLGILAGIYAVNVPGFFLRKIVLFAMVLAWCLRLIWLLVNRWVREKQEDRRYQKFRQEWGRYLQLKFFVLFLSEALLDVILSTPFFLICLNPTLRMSIWEWMCFGLWVIAFLGESISDEQMRRFKKNASHQHKVCRVGLWNYSRHPNYFFEWLMWAAYGLWALSAPYGWLGILSPIMMYYFLIHVTGVPLAEAMALQSKGQEYRRYQQETSFFVPWPKRKETL